MERFRVSLCIQSEFGKIWTRKNSVFGHSSCCAMFTYLMFLSTKILIFDTKMCISKIDVLLVTIVTPKSTVLSTKIFDVLCDLVPFVQFKKREKHP